MIATDAPHVKPEEEEQGEEEVEEEESSRNRFELMQFSIEKRNIFREKEKEEEEEKQTGRSAASR